MRGMFIIMLAIICLGFTTPQARAGDKEWAVIGKVLLGYEALKLFSGNIRYDRCYSHYHRYGCNGGCSHHRTYRYHRQYPYNSNDHYHYPRRYSSAHPRNCNCKYHSNEVRKFPTTESLERNYPNGGHTRFGYVYPKKQQQYGVIYNHIDGAIQKGNSYIVEEQQRVISEKTEIINGKKVTTKIIEKRTIIRGKQ